MKVTGLNTSLLMAVRNAKIRAKKLTEELEQSHQTSGLGVNIANVDFPIHVGYQGRVEIVYNQSALDDLLDYLVNNGVPYTLNPTDEVEPEQIPVGDQIEQLGEHKMAITRGQLRKIIRESLLNEADTSAYVGDHDPIYIEIPALESLATQENFDGEKIWHGEYDAIAIAEVLEEDEPTIEDYRYDEDAHEEALNKWNKINDLLDDFDSDDRKELAANIRSAKKEAEDSGYGY